MSLSILLKLYQTNISLFFLDDSTSIVFGSTRERMMNTMLLAKQGLVKKLSRHGKDVLEKINSSR